MGDKAIWTSFVEAQYLADARTYVGKCPTCRSYKDCNNYYCLICKEGGLCSMVFRGPSGEHSRHPWLQVRRLSCRSAVDPEELAKFLNPETVQLLQSCLLNIGSLCYLLRKASDPHRSPNHISPARLNKLKRCSACEAFIANSQDVQQDILLCSVECLITLAERCPERNLLALQEEALAPTDVFPLTLIEKTTIKNVAAPARANNRSLPAPISNAVQATHPPATRVTRNQTRTGAVNSQALHHGGFRPAGADRTPETASGDETGADRTPEIASGDETGPSGGGPIRQSPQRTRAQGENSSRNSGGNSTALPPDHDRSGLLLIADVLEANEDILGPYDLDDDDIGR